MVDTRQADCDICGERFHGSDIERYMTERNERDSYGQVIGVLWVCKHHND